jgi:Uma2 family endonuclease
MSVQKLKKRGVKRSEDLHPQGGKPVWEVAYLFLPQGRWTEQDYFDIERYRDGVHPLLELSNGGLEVLSIPTELHQLIAAYLFKMLTAFTDAKAPGLVPFMGLRVGLETGRFREPDVVYLSAEHSARRREKYWEGADLIMEVVSPDPDDRKRDLVTKPVEYAQAGVPEYWIIDPQEKWVRVFVLEDQAYKLHGEFRGGATATSVLLPGFSLSVDTDLAPPGSEKPG